MCRTWRTAGMGPVLTAYLVCMHNYILNNIMLMVTVNNIFCTPPIAAVSSPGRSKRANWGSACPIFSPISQFVFQHDTHFSLMFFSIASSISQPSMVQGLLLQSCQVWLCISCYFIYKLIHLMGSPVLI